MSNLMSISKLPIIRPVLISVLVLAQTSLLIGCGTQKKQKSPEEVKAFWEAASARAAESTEKEKLQTAERQRLYEYRKDAGKRNAERISALGFSTDLSRSSIYGNVLGVWGEFMPCTQWIGLLLENKNFESVTPISNLGKPGVQVKQKGRPALGIIFRLEGTDAYPYAMVSNGKTSTLLNSADLMSTTNIMGILTRDDETFRQFFP